ncbi:hypothetical protein [Bacillus subtilis]|uniref:hypothetical protein n=1 Tax=Bacillus subtilis TaxID=1423 RepID=UPI003F6E2659
MNVNTADVNLVGSMSLNEFLEIAKEEYQALTGIPEAIPFDKALLQSHSEESLEAICGTFCDFIDTVILNFMDHNQFFSENEFISYEPAMYCDSDEQGINEFDCFVESIFKRNGKYHFFRIGYVFTYKDIENEFTFQTCLTAIENSLKSQIQGCYQNDKPSTF